MSWPDIYPILTDEMVELYECDVTATARNELDDAFAVRRLVNARQCKHLVSTSLFWKNPGAEEAELPPITKELMQNAAKHGLVSRHAPWDHYVLPLLQGAVLLQTERPDIVMRVYLAADMEFLLEDLVNVGCEVALMHGSSLRHSPGAMWRFLAFEDSERWVTVIDADHATEMMASIERTEIIMASGLGLWRLPYVFDAAKHQHPGRYRPIIACHFGARSGQPMDKLMRAFLWHTQRQTMPNECVLTAGKQEPLKTSIYGTQWPTYGFDEWFLLAAYYPRMAFEGVLTFFKHGHNLGPWFALDLEYVTWANPLSEFLFYGDLTTYSEMLETAQPPTDNPLEQACCGHDPSALTSGFRDCRSLR